MEILAVAAILGLLPAAIAASKGRNFLIWWIYGTVLFIVAVIHILLMSSQKTSESELSMSTAPVLNQQATCPTCQKTIPYSSEYCRYCNQIFEPPESVASGVKACPYCAETIKAAAIVCRHCGRDVGTTEVSQIQQKECRYCTKIVQSEADYCEHCGKRQW